MKNEIFKKMRTMILLLGVTLFFSSFVSSDDDYIIINCPVVDACVPDAENDGKGLVCVIKKIKTGEIKFACDPKGEKDNCRTDSWGHELSCPNATIVIPN